MQNWILYSELPSVEVSLHFNNLSDLTTHRTVDNITAVKQQTKPPTLHYNKKHSVRNDRYFLHRVHGKKSRRCWELINLGTSPSDYCCIPLQPLVVLWHTDLNECRRLTGLAGVRGQLGLFTSPYSSCIELRLAAPGDGTVLCGVGGWLWYGPPTTDPSLRDFGVQLGSSPDAGSIPRHGHFVLPNVGLTRYT
jgi:hypothetical protein